MKILANTLQLVNNSFIHSMYKLNSKTFATSISMKKITLEYEIQVILSKMTKYERSLMSIPQ